jgi:hypothetical protein
VPCDSHWTVKTLSIRFGGRYSALRRNRSTLSLSLSIAEQGMLATKWAQARERPTSLIEIPLMRDLSPTFRCITPEGWCVRIAGAAPVDISWELFSTDHSWKSTSFSSRGDLPCRDSLDGERNLFSKWAVAADDAERRISRTTRICVGGNEIRKAYCGLRASPAQDSRSLEAA